MFRLPATSSSWSATGSTLAVSFGRFDHVGWCNCRRGAVCMWRVFRRKGGGEGGAGAEAGDDVDKEEPDLVLETEVCAGRACWGEELGDSLAPLPPADARPISLAR